MQNMTEITLESLCKGKVEKQFEEALSKLVSNCLDENTMVLKTRKLIITLEAIPNEARNRIDYVVKVDTKLQPILPVGSSIFWEGKDEERVLYEPQDVQGEMFSENLNDQVKKFKKTVHDMGATVKIEHDGKSITL